ncbi:MAG: DNA gyrase inhibitor YacG [Proteobacteria bacterium]|nr:MAG: DNA gyrase inhibitor YacG [Pseudomonadota bacterium]
MNEPITTVPCPSCGKPSYWRPENRWRPFCSERCKLLDLSEWMDGSRRIPGASDVLLPPDVERDESADD